jgi:hypothetical protein
MLKYYRKSEQDRFLPSTLQLIIYCLTTGRDSSVGIVTGYGLDGPGIESLWWSRFFATVQTDPETRPASYTLDTGSFLRVKPPGPNVDHPHYL